MRGCTAPPSTRRGMRTPTSCSLSPSAAGIDAITTDEVRSILEKRGKLYTQIKIDEINNLGVVKNTPSQHARCDRGTEEACR